MYEWYRTNEPASGHSFTLFFTSHFFIHSRMLDREVQKNGGLQRELAKCTDRLQVFLDVGEVVKTDQQEDVMNNLRREIKDAGFASYCCMSRSWHVTYISSFNHSSTANRSDHLLLEDSAYSFSEQASFLRSGKPYPSAPPPPPPHQEAGSSRNKRSATRTKHRRSKTVLFFERKNGVREITTCFFRRTTLLSHTQFKVIVSKIRRIDALASDSRHCQARLPLALRQVRMVL